MSCDHLCEDCQKKRQIKYTEIEDINNLINKFSGNITGGNRKTKMYMDVYDLYYDYIGELIFKKFTDKSENSKKILEWLSDEDLEEEIREDLDDKQGMIDIYNEYIPLGSGEFNLFDSDIRQTLLGKIHDAYYELEFEIMIDVFYDIKELFSSRVKNKTFFKFFTSLSKE
jgi:hypothetical protein